MGRRIGRAAINSESSSERLSVLHGVYKRQLEQYAGAKYVLPFKMEDSGGRTEYFLFFCTNSLKGLSVMKDAMYRVDPSGNFSYSYAANPGQLQLFDAAPDFSRLRTEVSGHFSGRTVSVEEIEEFVLVETAFLSTHYKRQVLAPMERDGAIEVVSTRNRRLTYPARTRISFHA